MKFSIGNILFYWPKNKTLSFYAQASTSDAQCIYLGESVCSKRRELSLKEYLEIANTLQAQGKQVVLTSLALIEAKSELASLKKICQNGNFLVEANDFGAVEFLSRENIPFVAGAALNIYNQYDLKVLVDKGMKRWVMPVELSKDWLEKTLQGCEELGIRDKFEVEVYGYGYLPLAYSARCFTARSENKPKDQCQLCCINYPQGRAICSQESNQKNSPDDNQEQSPLFIMNGIQTMSGKIQNLINDLPAMQGLVDIVRISPNSPESLAWLTLFKQNIKGDSPIKLQDYCNGYWHKIEGMATIEA